MKHEQMKPSPWREIHERRGGVLGGDLKCAKGRWTSMASRPTA